MTAEEFVAYAPPDGLRCELVRGEVQCAPRPGHEQIATTLSFLLTQFARPGRLGTVFVGRGYVLARGPDTVRTPDVSFVAAAHSEERAPDLAVELRSAGDRREAVAEYLAAGTRLVWAIDPARRTATIHAPGAPPRSIGEDDALDGGDVVPGFPYPLRDVLDW